MCAFLCVHAGTQGPQCSYGGQRTSTLWLFPLADAGQLSHQIPGIHSSPLSVSSRKARITDISYCVQVLHEF